MTNLEKAIAENAQQYYTTGKQALSDDAFDSLVDAIKANNPNSEVLKTGWGYESENTAAAPKTKHKYTHIGSLQKVHTSEELIKKLNSRRLKIAAKLDGLSLVMYYKDGQLCDAITRGNGEEGISILDKAKHIPGVMFELLDHSFTGAVRGEIFMTPSMFEQYKLKYPEAKNPRNSAAGIINSITSDDYQYLSCYVYTIVAQENNAGVMSINKAYDWLLENFLNVVPNTNFVLSLTQTPTEDAKRLTQELIELKEKFEKIVVIDGLVITAETVGYDAKTKAFKYNQLAYKFQDEMKATKVLRIEWTMSKHQAYIPVVVFEPIELEGTTVQRASGYNAAWIQKMNIQEGSIVFVRKSNQIIPQIMEILNLGQD